MLVVVSPAKRLDWNEVQGPELTVPEFQEDATYLAERAAKLSKPALQKLMGISEDLARLNQTRFRVFQAAPETEDLRPAMRAFAGDTYQGLEAKSLDGDAVRYAQGHLRILSGLYGLLRPLDGIQPYRLEMGSRLKTRKADTLYAYWGARISDALNRQAAETDSQMLLNCASNEYFSAVDLGALSPQVITPVFLEERGGEQKIISFFAKKARGAMARFVVEHRIRHPKDLAQFDYGGYRLDPGQSDPLRPVFVRSEAAQAA